MPRSKVLLTAVVAAWMLLPQAASASVDSEGAHSEDHSARRHDGAPETREASRRRIRYTVERGDTLSEIARDYGVSVADIRRWNDLDSDFIRAGQVLTLSVSGSSSARNHSELVYVVERGDTLARIADRHEVTVSDLVRWNRGIDRDFIRTGQEIRILVEGLHNGSSSVGSPDRGRLSSGIQLDDGPGYRVRNPSRSYGTEVTVHSVQSAFSRVNRRYPEAPQLAVGDISYARGGPMRPHASHQSGRDIDIAYYTLGREHEDGFVVATPEILDVSRTWYLLKSFIDSGDVRYIFLDYDLQAVLYDYVRRRGASAEELSRWFQYPREDAGHGIIRHARGHDDHFHIRFRCSGSDSRCDD